MTDMDFDMDFVRRVLSVLTIAELSDLEDLLEEEFAKRRKFEPIDIAAILEKYGELNENEKEEARRNKILAIKLYRIRTGCCLKQGLDVVEAWLKQETAK